VLGSVFVIVGVNAHEADKSESSVLVRHLDNASDVSEGLKKSAKVFIIVVIRVVLDIQVVSNAADITTVLWLVLDSDAVLVFISFSLSEHLHGKCGVFGVFISNETISTRRMVLIHRYLQRLDWALHSGVKERELVIELFVSHALGDLAHEDGALLVGLHEVCSEKCVVEGQSTALLSLNLEVAKDLCGFLELGVVLDAADARVERLGGVTPYLRLELELDSRVFEDLCETCRGELSLGKVV